MSTPKITRFLFFLTEKSQYNFVFNFFYRIIMFSVSSINFQMKYQLSTYLFIYYIPLCQNFFVSTYFLFSFLLQTRSDRYIHIQRKAFYPHYQSTFELNIISYNTYSSHHPYINQSNFSVVTTHASMG